jgi:hypothetical protein
MDRDLVFYEFSRLKVNRGDFQYFPSLKLPKVGGCGRW